MTTTTIKYTARNGENPNLSEYVSNIYINDLITDTKFYEKKIK